MELARRWFIIFFTTLVFALCPPRIRAQCPGDTTIKPCTCNEAIGGAAQMSCRGPVGLSRLTTILRKEMCGKTLDKFELMDSDVEYLPSNLFFKIIVKDIQVSFTNISHFTRAGRSAFFGLERHLRSLSMRRCRLVDNLEWRMIGDLQVLTYLDLSYNDLTRVPRQWFLHPPPNLLSLILKGNRISTLEAGALTYMHKLIELDLSENNIAMIRRDVFPHPGNTLLFLRLNDNILTSLPEDLFDEMLGLRRIYLDDNKLKTLPENLWNLIWGDLEHLDLNGNPLLCECDMLWVAQLRPPRRLYGECHSQNKTAIILRNLEIDHFESCIIQNITLDNTR